MKMHRLLLLLLIAVLLAPACGDDDDDSSADSGQDDDDDDDDTVSDDDDATPGDDDDEDDDDNDDTGDDDTPTPTDYVDPFIGTAGDHGQLHAAATYPFGMVKLGPDMLGGGHAGYDYNRTRILGFSHTRIGGVGCSGAGGDVLILPGVGETTDTLIKMDKATETAEPGYYAVELGPEEVRISAELTVGERAGVHRYVFPDGQSPYLYINFNSAFAGSEGSEWTADEDEISGWVAGQTVCNYGRYRVYFHIKFSRSFAEVHEISSLTGMNARVDFDATSREPLLIRVTLSSVDEAQARIDGEAEMPDWEFDAMREQAKAAWNERLGVVEVAGDEALKGLFYTMLYRAMQTPVNITATDGRYRGVDGEIHQADGYAYHHCWSLWDTYRSKYSLLTLLAPERVVDLAQSLVDLYQQGKVAWADDNEPFPTVRTEHAVGVLLDAYRKGIDDFALADAYEAILAEAETLPVDSPDHVLETSYDHWAVAHIAEVLDDEETRDEFLMRSAAYEETWLDKFKVMGPNADIMHAEGLYEGTLWQYRWAVVHDIPGMVELDDGREVFLGKLIQFFDEELYNHGNEPDIHAPFLFNYVGAPWRTQDLVRALATEEVNQWYGTHEKWLWPYHGRIYRPLPTGYIPQMDDDAGTMSAWFALAAMGLYQVTVGQPVYVLSGPLFEEVTLQLEGGATFRIVAENLSAENRFIQSATLNGDDLPRAWITYDEIMAGGELTFLMGATPNQEWGADEEQAPPPAFD